jgi:hypothetical protein
MTGWVAALALLAQAAAASSSATQASSAGSGASIRGEASVLADALPRKDATELRPEARIEADLRVNRVLRAHLDVTVTALVADRVGAEAALSGRPNDTWVEIAWARGDLRAGYGRIVWGRLDEIQPSDVINPIDAARFILMGRSEARRGVAFVRGRLMPSDRVTIEGVLNPVFRRGTFDELDEVSSPFNLVRDVVLPAGVPADVVHETPAAAWRNLSGGARLAATFGRVDVAGAVYRGFDSFGLVTFEPIAGAGPGAAVVGRLVERYPRFTMIAADLETVTGEWAWRGEVAAFVEKQLSATSRPGGVDGRVLEAGFGFDRPAGDYRVFGSTVVRREWSTEDPAVNRTHVNIVGSLERSFGQERYRARGFVVVNPGDAAAFVRGLFVWNLRDNVALEGSAAAFLGMSDDALGRFKDRDFLFTRLRYWF